MADHRPIDLPHACGAFIIIVVALSGCGGGSSAKPLAEESIVTQTRVLREQLVSTDAIADAPAGSLRRAFLSYWRSVQFADTEAVLDAYEPGLRSAVGAELLALAVRMASDTYRTQRPRVEEVRQRENEGVVRYFGTTQASGTRVVPMSIVWRRHEGRWRIRFSSALDVELRIAAQTRAQLNFKPGSPEIDPRALRAGERAAALQAGYLGRLDERVTVAGDADTEAGPRAPAAGAGRR